MSIHKEFKWPSERVCQGGLFHPPKVKYSHETNNLLKILMEEAKLSMFMRKKIDYHLRNGEPLPAASIAPQNRRDSFQNVSHIDFEIRMRSRFARRRSYDVIKASGAYDNSKYRPPPNLKTPSDVAKLKLQEKMSGIKIYSDENKKKVRSKKDKQNEISLNVNEQIDELLEEIFERVNWLKEMEELGEGKQYRVMIQSQIQERLRQIKILENKNAKENK